MQTLPRVVLASLSGACVWLTLSGCGDAFHSMRSKSSSDDLPGPRAQAAAAPAQVAPQPQAEHYATQAYDRVTTLVADAETAEAQGALDAAGTRLRQIMTLAKETLERIDRDRLSGTWLPGQRYPTQRDGVLPEADLVAKLGEMRAAAETHYASAVRPVVRARLKTRYKAVSEDQIDLLEREGKPREVQKKGRETCWVFDGDKQVVTYCFDHYGALTRRMVRDTAIP